MLTLEINGVTRDSMRRRNNDDPRRHLGRTLCAGRTLLGRQFRRRMRANLCITVVPDCDHVRGRGFAYRGGKRLMQR